MKTLLIGCLGLVALIILSLGACTYFIVKAVEDLPPDAKRETLFNANRSLLERIDLAIRESTTLAACSERLRLGISDPKVIWLQLSEPGSRQQLETIKRESWTGNSTMVINGAGSGTLTGKFGTHAIRIIHSQERSATGPVFEYTLYLAVDSENRAPDENRAPAENSSPARNSSPAENYAPATPPQLVPLHEQPLEKSP